MMEMDNLEKRPHKCATNVANRGMSGRFLPILVKFAASATMISENLLYLRRYIGGYEVVTLLCG